MYMDCQAGNKFCWLGCGDLGRNKVCPLQKHRGARGMKFQNKCEGKDCFVFLCDFPLLLGPDKPIQQSFSRPHMFYFSIILTEQM